MEEENNKKQEPPVRVAPEFKARIEKFIKEYGEKKGLKISFVQATQILENKIRKQGGLFIE